METWTLKFTDWDLKEELLRETLMTLGNGYFATRGAAEESLTGENHYPGTYLAGGYNRLQSVVAGNSLINEDLVNWPNWLCLKFRFPFESWFDIGQVKLLGYIQELDMKQGVLRRLVHFQDSSGHETKIESFRIVSMDNPHIGAISWTIEPINWTSEVEVKSTIDISIKNAGVKRYSGLSNRHLKIMNKEWGDDGTFILDSITSQSQLHLSQAIRTEVFESNQKLNVSHFPIDTEEEFGVVLSLDLKKGVKTSVEKVMTLFSSKDHAIADPRYEAEKLLLRLPTFSELLKRHVREWERIWKHCDIDLFEKKRETQLIRLHIFHLLQTVSFKSIDLDVGVPARGLHGEAYRGHIFWDELFILPFLNLRIPELSRALLMYRYRRLDGARKNAKDHGFLGALYPWQSGSNGEEESQIYHLNPLSQRWIPDATSRQRHINASIIYNIWQYYQVSDDRNFLSHYGAEMALEICRFWISSLTFNEQKKRYEILNIVGPDEFHTHYPNGEETGINNNAYTNYMASWCIKITVELLFSLSEKRQEEILKSIDLTLHEIGHWQDLSRKVYLPLGIDGIMNQFEGFENLKDLDWKAYRLKYGNIQRIDRILESESDDVNFYKINKQSDVLMLYYLFSPEELKQGHEWLGYPFEEEWIKKNIDYHLALSSNGSTLSRIVHAWVLARYDIDKSWEWFYRALETDVADIQGDTTHEGIHLGAMAGTVDLVQRCFTGIEVRQDTIYINPRLPKEINNIQLTIKFRGHTLSIKYQKRIMEIIVDKSLQKNAKLAVGKNIFCIKQGTVFKFPLD